MYRNAMRSRLEVQRRDARDPRGRQIGHLLRAAAVNDRGPSPRDCGQPERELYLYDHEPQRALDLGMPDRHTVLAYHSSGVVAIHLWGPLLLDA